MSEVKKMCRNFFTFFFTHSKLIINILDIEFKKELRV